LLHYRAQVVVLLLYAILPAAEFATELVDDPLPHVGQLYVLFPAVLGKDAAALAEAFPEHVGQAAELDDFCCPHDVQM